MQQPRRQHQIQRQRLVPHVGEVYRHRVAFEPERAERLMASGFTVVSVDSSQPDLDEGHVGRERYGWIREQFDEPGDITALVDGGKPFLCVMLGQGYDELIARGVPLTEMYAREGMWATSGRALWRQAVAPTRFLVVTSRDETARW